jgi:hypothetical protein
VPAHQPLCHGEHLLLPAAQRPAAVVPLRGNLREDGQCLLDTGGTLPPRQVIGGEQEVVGHAELGEDAMPLHHMHQPRPRRAARPGAAHVLPAEADAAAGPGQQAGDGAQQCRLPRAVRAEKRDHLARPDAQVHAMQHGDLAVIGLDPPHLQQRIRIRDMH